jgi:hypothetical protein
MIHAVAGSLALIALAFFIVGFGGFVSLGWSVVFAVLATMLTVVAAIIFTFVFLQRDGY